MMYNYSSEWIHKQEALHHWNYYWYQIGLLNDVLEEGDSILEIGVGTRFTSNYLKSKGFNVTTIDIDPAKKPDIVANIVEYAFPEKFDHILAFEVFEHIPFEDFKLVLSKINKVFNKNVLISLPRNEKVWLSARLEFPGSMVVKTRITTRRNKILSKNHHWEIDYKEYTRAFLEKTFEEFNFMVKQRKKVYSLYFYSLENL